uniref:Putative transcription factor spt20 n=1 Tax=Lutzomyia longipalpis TaxID=7200 RepID=A0A7G3AYZ8_LUTLO
MELSAEDVDFQHTNLGAKTSFLLDKLVAKENLNTLILNLYPGNKGYSLAFKGDVEVIDVANHMMDCNPQTRKALAAPKEKIQETIRWPYEEEDLLECIDNETLPLVLVDLFQTKCPNLFYSGCVIVEVRDYRQSFPIYTCDTYHVLLRPTNQTLIADVNSLTSVGQWTHEEKLALESQLVLATAEPLCLDPNPAIGIHVINSQHQRRMFNTKDIRRKTKKFTQVSINRKRKTDQFTHHYGLDLYDYMSRFRQRSRHMKVTPSTTTSANALSSSSFTNSMAFRLHQQQKKTADGMSSAVQQPPVPSPYLGFPPLTPPTEVNVHKFARAYERPKETKDCMPQLIEQYILETDHMETNQRGRVYYIKLSIFQRPANNEYLGELYVDKDYREDVRNGEACQFTLGTRANANKYIQQFSEIITEEGRLRVKITHLVPGQPPRVTCTAGVQLSPDTPSGQERLHGSPARKKMKKSKKVLKNESPERKQRTDTGNKNSNFHIFDKLRELYMELSAEDVDFQHTNLGAKTSFLLDKLVAKENLNTLILNLYPGNKGYSLAFKGDVEVIDVANHMMDCNPQTRKALAAPKERFRKQYGGLMRRRISSSVSTMRHCPSCLSTSFKPSVLISSTLDVRDYRQSFPIYTCDTYHVLLRPTNQTLIADVNSLTSVGQWTHEEKLALESQLVLATAEPLCLDPNPAIGIHVINSQHQRRMFNTKDIRRKTKKFTQVSINRKRKTDQFTHHYGLDLYDYMSRFRQRSRHMKVTPSTTTSANALSSSSFTNSMAFRLHQQQKKTADGMSSAVQQPPVPSPYLGFPPLTPPTEVNVHKFARAYERPKETKDCMPQLIEQYILETDHMETNQRGRVYYIKLSIFQRPANNEYLGELYVDKDYREDVRNGEACQFTLGTRANANKYIQQFSEIITEEGRLRVKITHLVPGQPPRVTCTAGVQETPINHRQPQQQQQQQQLQQLQQQQQPQQTITQFPPATYANDGGSGNATEQPAPVPQQLPAAPVMTPQQVTQQQLPTAAPSGSIMVFQQPGGVSNFLPIRQNILPSEMGVSLQGRTHQVVPIAAKPTLANPTINAIVTNLISSSEASQGTVAGELYGQSPSKSSNNSTIINLLNSAPAAMNISNVNSFLSPPAYKELTGAPDGAEKHKQPGTKVAPVKVEKDINSLHQQHIKLQAHPIPSTLVSQLVSPPLTVTTSELDLKRTPTAVAIAGGATLKRPAQQQLLIASNSCNKISLKPQPNHGPQKISKLSFPVTELTGLLTTPATPQEIPATVAFAQPKQFVTGDIQLTARNLHQSLQSPPTASPLVSSPSTLPQQTTTTLNLQGISLSSLQNAMATIPGTFQNVQIQIPGLAQSLSLPIGGAGTTFATSTSQATGLLVNTVHSGTLSSIPGSGTQTVVLTNSATDSGASMLSLPVAHVVTTGLKGINHPNLRSNLAATASTSGQTVTNAAAPSIQLFSTLMQSGVPLSLAPAGTATVKQKPIIISEQQATVAQQKQQVLNSVKKIATTSNALHANAIQQASINAGQLVLPAQNLQLKFHKQPTVAAFDAGGGNQQQMVVSPATQRHPNTEEQAARKPTPQKINPKLQQSAKTKKNTNPNHDRNAGVMPLDVGDTMRWKRGCLSWWMRRESQQKPNHNRTTRNEMSMYV